MKNLKPNSKSHGLWFAALLAGILTVLFWRSFLPEYVHFSNDGPLGVQASAWTHLPDAFTGTWDDLNDVGSNAGAWPIEASQCLRWLLGPVGYAKFSPPVFLFALGLGAWFFFRQLKLTPVAATLGALAAMLNSAYFAGACWGVGLQELAFGLDFTALALVMANTAATPWRIRWARLALAGLCVGMNMMDAADIGALCSIFVALVIFYKALCEAEGTALAKALRGIGRVIIVAVFAGFLAAQFIMTLISTNVQGISGNNAQDTESKSQHWDWATQWSLPKLETVGLFVPGVFGYKMDTPKDMMPQFQKSFEGGVYWGGIGRSPEIDRYLDSGAQGQMPQGFMRFTGGENYCGILVCLLAALAVAQSLRKKDSPFSDPQKKMIWFWVAVLAGSILLAWGRFAPMFYGALYQLPYFSTIRNPAKFLVFSCWALVVLFAYGVHALSVRNLDGTAAKPANLTTQLKLWWARVSGFDRKWTLVCAGLFGVSVLGWLIYAGEKNSLISYLQKMGYPDETFARQIATFSLGEVGWFVGLLAAAIALTSLTLAGYFSGPRAKIGAALLGVLLVFDLGRANLPYIIHWDYKQKYEVGSLNPIVDFLGKQPNEHRVAGLPFRAPEGMELLDQMYRIEWMQHHFPFYNIQSLDIVQMPRMPEDLKAYLEALSPRGTAESVPLIARHWMLTNTRYLLGAAGYLDVLNQQLDPAQHRFSILQRFEIVPKPGILQPGRLEELTAVPNENGRYALFEFTGALPRAKLYSSWLVNTNDSANLKTLADLNFDPAKTVLISTPQKNLPAVATNENPGTVEFKSYSSKKLVFTVTNTTVPTILLLNDKYDPAWRVTVDGQPAQLLRCNFLMRGVHLPAGARTVVFDFSQPSKALYITLAALGLGIFLSLFLWAASRSERQNG